MKTGLKPKIISISVNEETNEALDILKNNGIRISHIVRQAIIAKAEKIKNEK